MRVTQVGRRQRVLVVGALAALGIWAIGVRAVENEEQKVEGVALVLQPPSATKSDSAPAGKLDSPAKPTEKLVTFEMRNQPWKAMIEWFADQSGLTYIGVVTPAGSF